MNGDYFTPAASRELEDIASFIARQNPRAAEAFLQAAVAAACRVINRPGIGTTRPMIASRYRFWPITRYPYLLVYDARDQPLRILRVIHMARDLPRILADPPS